METLIQSGDLFTVDRHRAYRKLKEDMVSDAGGWLREVVANALDAQTAQGDRTSPIRVSLRRDSGVCTLDIADSGTGLTERHLEALHYMGRTTKIRAPVDGLREDIGQFGLGFLAVFAKRNGMRTVTIHSRTTDGIARRIRIENRHDERVPQWRELDVEDHDPMPPGHGTCFRFEMDVSQEELLGSLMTDLCARTIVPVLFNGTLYAHTPRELLGHHAPGVVVEAADPTHGIEVMLSASHGPRDRDRALLYLRRMPAESGSANEMFGNGGDKFAGRAYGRPYLQDESMVVVTQVGESTLARDKVVRDQDYGLVMSAVNAARAKAVAALLDEAARTRKGTLDSSVEDTYLANLETLYRHVAAHLEGREVPDALRPAADAVARFPFFAVYDSTTRYSLAELHRMRSTRHGVFLHARTQDVASQFSHTAPVTLRESDSHFRQVFGFWPKSLCRGLLAGVFGAMTDTDPKPTVQSMEEIINNSTLAVQLEEKGVIRRTDYTVKPTTISDPGMLRWFEAVRTMMNQAWFRSALSSYDDVRIIRLVPVVVTDSSELDSDFLAMGLQVPDAAADEYVVGIRTDSSAARSLAAAGTARENLLPTVVQVASCISRHHYGRFELEQEQTTQVAYTNELLLDMYGLEDRVIRRYLRVLNSGQEDAETEESPFVIL